MKDSINSEQTFQAASILAAISVPVLTAIANFGLFSNNMLPIRSVALAGFFFLLAALLSFFELIEISNIPSMKVSEAFKVLFSSKGAILVGLILLLVFQIIQSRILFQ